MKFLKSLVEKILGLSFMGLLFWGIVSFFALICFCVVLSIFIKPESKSISKTQISSATSETVSQPSTEIPMKITAKELAAEFSTGTTLDLVSKYLDKKLIVSGIVKSCDYYRDKVPLVGGYLPPSLHLRFLIGPNLPVVEVDIRNAALGKYSFLKNGTPEYGQHITVYAELIGGDGDKVTLEDDGN